MDINLSIYQSLSETFIKEFQDRVNWVYISIHQSLSEKFIREFHDKVDWYYISKYQSLSEEFIREFQDKVDWYCIPKYQSLSEEFIKEFNLEIPNTCWLYKTKEEKLKYIRDNNLDKVYELSKDNNYLYAYKSCRSDGYSLYNFQYKYEVGKEYESHCDCNVDNENSFGLSAWTKEKALEYHSNGLLLKVKIAIEDIGCFVHDNYKIRCKRLEVLKKC